MTYKVLKTFTKPDFIKTHEKFSVGEDLTEDDLVGKNIKGLLSSGFLESEYREPLVELVELEEEEDD